MTTCSNPSGFDISYPTSWVTNQGNGIPGCSQFHPEPFEVPLGTDERVAAITAYIDPVPFHEAASQDHVRAAERDVTTIDGFQAVRIAHEIEEDHLYPVGTAVTQYMIDLTLGIDEDPRTLFVDTIGLSGMDYAQNQTVLDRMARSVAVTGSRSADVIARYEGGGGGFTVSAQVSGDRICLRIPPRGEPSCADPPEEDGLITAGLVDLRQELLAGVTGSDVFRVTVDRRDGTESRFLPAPVPDSESKAFAFTFPEDEARRITWHSLTGEILAE